MAVRVLPAVLRCDHEQHDDGYFPETRGKGSKTKGPASHLVQVCGLNAVRQFPAEFLRH